MSLFQKLKGQLIDIIEFLNNDQNIIVHRFDRYGNNIMNNAKLVVREGQQAVFISEGQLADVYSPGTYTLNTQNMPVMTMLRGWKYGFNSPFKAEVYFVSTKTFIDQRWGTKNPIILSDPRFGMIETRAFGTYNFKIDDAGKFITTIVGTNGTFSTEDIENQLRSIIVTRFSNATGQINLPIESYAANLSDLSTEIFGYMKDDFNQYGMEVNKFLIENVSMPDEIKKEIFEYSRLGVIDLDKLTKLKAAKAIEDAANNPGGMAGLGAGMGAGFGIAGQMAGAMGQMVTNPTQQQQQPQQQAQQQTGAVPPPLPNASIEFYVAENGKQTGPFLPDMLQQMVKEGRLTKDTLVWRAGMAEWQAAGLQQELSNVWGAMPPPIPTA